MNLNSFAGATRALSLAVAATGLVIAGSASADTLVQNSTPADTWFYGSGNGYAPANTLVLTTDAGDQLYARAHQTFVAAPASVGGAYYFATSPSPVSFDWGFDSASGTFTGTAQITLTNYAGGSFSYDPLFIGNDNAVGSGSTQNSFRWNWVPGIAFNPAVDGKYNFRLDVSELSGLKKSITFDMIIGRGLAVPEPSTWALMIGGFGLAGVALRRRRAVTA